MLSSIRRAPAVLRSLRIAPSIPSSSIRSLNISRLQSDTFAVSYHFKQFSSASRRFQEIAEERDIEESADAAPEYTQFEELGRDGIVHPNVISTITGRMNIHTMTEVQRMTLNSCLDGSDVIAQAKTGTGKTLAFLLPIIQRVLRDERLAKPSGRFTRAPVDIRALIVSPTRELAEQIAVEASRLVGNTGLKVQTAVGGTGKSYHLQKMQREGCHLLIGTPGRIIDLLGDPRSGVELRNLETFVLDEADRLLDIGFAPAIKEMQSYMPDIKTKDRQTLMFSATVPKSVVSLVRETMRPDFKFVRTVDPNEPQTHERVPQKVVFLNNLQNQFPAILDIATQAIKAHKEDPVNNMPFKAIVYFGATTQSDLAYDVFNNMRDPTLETSARYSYQAHPLYPCKIFRMNGGLQQSQRQRETSGFRTSESAILFSTDVTARGMDFPNVSHVIQLGLPRSSDDYVHRLGRTGRAGKPGQGWLLLNEDERRDFARAFQHKGITMQPVPLDTASLDMSRASQVSAATAKLLQMVETGVKTVPYATKAAVYRSLLGVMAQQFPGRSKQTQIDMMNDLAKYGWGLQTPPTLPRILVNKLGFSNVRGIEIETDREGRPESGRRGAPGRDNGQFGGRGRGRDDRNDPFNMGSGKGVFGGGSSGRGRSRDAFGDM